MDTKLLPIDKIIAASTKLGARFGKGDAKIHLAYLTKLGILPQTIRRKIEGQITGCYPESVIPTILKAEELKNSGLSYSQIRYQLATRELAPTLPLTTTQPAPAPSSSWTFLLIGLLFGYLLATRPASTPVSPLDPQAQTMLSIVNQGNQSNEPIYVVTAPRQNFYRLGAVNINDLVKTQ